MRKYNSRRHQKLMDESEYALQSAAESSDHLKARVVTAILQDSKSYQLWESRHASLLLPIAKQSNKKRQIIALRIAAVRLIHRRALFECIQSNSLRGRQRRQLFRIFHETLDYQNAILVEHRQYKMAVSSGVSADHLIEVMNDPTSRKLLSEYKRVYAQLFKMKCYVAGLGDANCADLVRDIMRDTRERLRQLRHRIETEPPAGTMGDFDRQEALAQSGRYPIIDYMVG